MAVVWGIAWSVGCTAALQSSNSASEGLGSVSSVSDSLAEAGSSISSSSSDGAASAALERDVSTYTAIFTGSGGDVGVYLRGVGALCETYAVSDWERDPSVWRGIALGLARSPLSEREIGVFAERIAGGDVRMRDRLHAAAVAAR